MKSKSKGVHVVVRVRPFLQTEQDKAGGGLRSHVLQTPDTTGDDGLLRIRHKDASHDYRFDRVLDHRHSQRDVYQAARIGELVDSVLDGYNGTVFAYGQTGSGKTYTMDGFQYHKGRTQTATQGQSHSGDAQRKLAGSTFKPTVNESDRKLGVARNGKVKSRLSLPSPDNYGLCVRAIVELFDKITTLHAREDAPAVYDVQCSMLQIYQESVFDLLDTASLAAKKLGGRRSRRRASARAGLKVRWDARREFYVEGLTHVDCGSAKEVIRLLGLGLRNRIVASHRLNAQSSRSHSLFTLKVTRRTLTSNAAEAGEVVSQLRMCDLAGSERVAQTGVSGALLSQAIGINKSLFALRKVIKALVTQSAGAGDENKRKPRKTRGHTHVPYRDSCLTRLLKNSLGGNCLTVMVACLCPHDAFAEENVSTLNYAAMTARITNVQQVNEDPRQRMIRQLKEQVDKLRRALMTAHAQYSATAGLAPSGVDSLESAGIGALLKELITRGQQADGAVRVGTLSCAQGLHHSITTADLSVDALPPELRSQKTEAAQSELKDRSEPTIGQEGGAQGDGVACSVGGGSVEGVVAGQLAGLTAEQLSVKLIQCIGLLRAVSEQEQELYQQAQRDASQRHTLEGRVGSLQYENDALRDRVHYLETVILDEADSDVDVDEGKEGEEQDQDTAGAGAGDGDGAGAGDGDGDGAGDGAGAGAGAGDGVGEGKSQADEHSDGLEGFTVEFDEAWDDEPEKDPNNNNNTQGSAHGSANLLARYRQVLAENRRLKAVVLDDGARMARMAREHSATVQSKEEQLRARDSELSTIRQRHIKSRKASSRLRKLLAPRGFASLTGRRRAAGRSSARTSSSSGGGGGGKHAGHSSSGSGAQWAVSVGRGVASGGGGASRVPLSPRRARHRKSRGGVRRSGTLRTGSAKQSKRSSLSKQKQQQQQQLHKGGSVGKKEKDPLLMFDLAYVSDRMGAMENTSGHSQLPARSASRPYDMHTVHNSIRQKLKAMSMMPSVKTIRTRKQPR